MGAVERSDNVKVRNKRKNGITKRKFSQQQVGRPHNNACNYYPPSLLSQQHPFSPPAAAAAAVIMRPRPPFPGMGRMPPPGMGPMPPPGVHRLPPPGACPPPLFRNRVPPPPPPPPPGRMGPRGPMPPMRARPPLMGPPPLMRPPPPPPPMMGPRRFPPRLPPPPPPMLPPNKMRQLKHKMHHAKKNNKKKHQPQPHVDLCSPWMTNDMKREFEAKDKLFATAKESNKVDDWDRFKEQRAKCDKLYKTAKLDYIGMHPEEVFEEEYSDVEMSEYDYAESARQPSATNFCDACERGFANADQLKHHMQQHRVCGIDGCQFVAHEKIVEKHINMQHVTGLYYRIAKTNTPEDIAKWIEERKKKYPTKENIEKRQKQQQEMMKRGERIQMPKDRFGKHQKKDVQPHNSKRLDKNNKFTAKGKMEHHSNKVVPFKRKKPSIKPEACKTSLLDDRSTWNGNLPPFQGTLELYEDEEDDDGVESVIDDSEWLDAEVSKCETNNSVITTDDDSLIASAVPTIETNALGALMGAYGSSDESEHETVEPESKSIETVVQPIGKTETETGDEPPDEQKILKHDINEPKLEKFENVPARSTDNKQQNSRCRNRKRKRKFSREETTNPTETVNNTSEQRMVRRRVTLLERLLASEINHERNVILQCVRHVVQNNFFDKTEHSTDTSNQIPPPPPPPCSSGTTVEERRKESCDIDERKETVDNANTNIEMKSDE